jgi:membrane protease YdiL (CAAX protease family)
MGLGLSAVIFGGATVLLLVGTGVLIPYLHEITGLEHVLLWFLVAGLGVFTPLLLLALWLLQREGAFSQPNLWSGRLRFRRMSRRDWIWTIGAVVAIGMLSSVLMHVIQVLFGQMDHQPPFMAFEPLTPGRYWILAVWLPYWLLNIMGEEILWRGVMLPRQEAGVGRYAWLVNALGWMLFHVAFGWQLLVVLVPILFLLPYVVQRQQNSWVAVVIHGAVNGPSFLAISFGLL